MKLPTIKGSRVTLRRLVKSDAPTLQRNANNAAVARFLPLMPHPYGMHDALEWINTTHRQARRDRGYHFGVTVDNSEDIVGVIGLNNVNRKDSNAEVGYWIAEQFWGQGLGREMLNLMLGFCFDQLELHRVYAIVQSNNLGSIKVLEACRMQREGCYREASRMDGRFHDVYIYGILANEFRPS